MVTQNQVGRRCGGSCRGIRNGLACQPQSQLPSPLHSTGSAMMWMVLSALCALSDKLAAIISCVVLCI